MIALIYFWATRLPNHLAVQYLSVSTAMVVQWYTYLRDICSWYLLNAPPVALGGPGQVVQVDETLLTRTKYNGQASEECTSVAFRSVRLYYTDGLPEAGARPQRSDASGAHSPGSRARNRNLVG